MHRSHRLRRAPLAQTGVVLHQTRA
jgi:hypothetical protein